MSCKTCTHVRKPGRVDDGYCSVRDDLPPAYGADHPLHQLPKDGGARCEQHKEKA